MARTVYSINSVSATLESVRLSLQERGLTPPIWEIEPKRDPNQFALRVNGVLHDFSASRINALARDLKLFIGPVPSYISAENFAAHRKAQWDAEQEKLAAEREAREAAEQARADLDVRMGGQGELLNRLQKLSPERLAEILRELNG